MNRGVSVDLPVSVEKGGAGEATALLRVGPIGGRHRCDLRGVPLRTDEPFVLNVASAADAAGGRRWPPRLCADPSVPDAARTVEAKTGRCGDACWLEALAVGPLRAGGWLKKE